MAEARAAEASHKVGFVPGLEAALAEIRKGKGATDSVHDVDRLVALYRKHWGVVGPLVPAITETKLEAAGSTATKLKHLLLEPTDTKGTPKDLRSRAYTAWKKDYQSAVATTTYLAQLHPEQGELTLPSLRPEPKKAKPKQEAPPAAPPAAPQPELPTPAEA